MSTLWSGLVDPAQFAPPQIFPATISNRCVMLSLDCVRENINVLCISVGQHSLFYALSNRILRSTKLGGLVVGYELDSFPNMDILVNSSNTTVVIKFFDESSVSSDRSRGGKENPIHEIAAMQFLGNESSKHHLSHHIISAVAEDKLYLVMPYPYPKEEFQATDMLTFMQDINCNNPLRSEDELRHVFHCIMTGVAKFHEKDLSHRDLSLENILVVFDIYTNIKDIQIIDFGLVWHQITGTRNNYPSPYYGNPYYTPPEVTMNRNENYSIDPRKSDIWACGIILFVLATGQPPFLCAQPGDDNFDLVLSNPRHGLKHILSRVFGMNRELTEIINDMLHLDPLLRPSADAILNYDWLKPRC